MGAHGSKNHGSPIQYSSSQQFYQSVPAAARNANQRFDSAGEDEQENARRMMMLAQQQQYKRRPPPTPPNYRASRQQRPQLGYGNNETNRNLRPILASQLDATGVRNGRYSSSTNYRPKSVDRTTLAAATTTGTLQKQVQFSSAMRSNGSINHAANRVTFGSTSAIMADRDCCNDANAVFTRSKDSHHASQLAINVTYSRPETKTSTIDSRVFMSNNSRFQHQTNTLRRPHHALGVSAITRYRSDPALRSESRNNNSNNLPAVQHNDRFNVEDLQPAVPDYPSMQRRTVVAIDDDDDDSHRPKLRVLRQPPQPRRFALNAGSVTELSDVVAANSADSGVELKPELFSLLCETNQPHQPSSPPPPMMVQRRRSLPRHLLAASRTKPVNSNTLEKKQYSIPPCNCEDCRHPINATRNQPNRFPTATAITTRPRPRPLPPDPPKSPEEDDTSCYYYNDECPYEGCCCQGQGLDVSKDENDYQRLVHRSYKGQPPALRRGMVLPQKITTTRRQSPPPRDVVDNDDLYTAAFSGESTLLRQQNKPKSTKTNRAPDPPSLQRRRVKSMFVASSPGSEKENASNDGATFLAKEKNGTLVIVNRVDLEMGLLNGKYIQYDIAPPLLLDQAAKQVELQTVDPRDENSNRNTSSMTLPPPPQTLLMTCGVGEDSGNAGSMMETLSSSHYDSGVSPADSSSASNTTPASSSNTTTSGGADSNSSTGSPPLLPPRQRPGFATKRPSSNLISAANRNKLEQMLMMRNNISMHIEAVKNSSVVAPPIDTTLHELSCVSPPLLQPLEQ